MNTRKKRMMLAAALSAAFALPITYVRADNEFGANTPFYEDDAWYDVSEWFDGNDYNPTDEAIGRWDDEVFTFAANATSSDNDNFLNWGDYGYDTDDESDWFYDYYDDGFGTWDGTYYSTYYDTDDDGLYDAYSTYSDGDSDGFYEDFNYYAFDSQSENQDRSKQQAMDQQKQMKSTEINVAGNVEDTKMVRVRDRIHLVAKVNGPDGQPMMIDLGPDQTTIQLFEGDRLSATGHVVNVGQKRVLIASDAATKNRTIAIDRNGRKYQGTVKGTKTVNVRGTEHMLAKVETDEGKSMMVDLGPSQNLDRSLEGGSNVTVQGVPVKVKDRVVLMASKLMLNDKKTSIQRQVATTN